MPRASNPTTGGLSDTWGRRNRRLSGRACPACSKDFRPLRASSRFCSRPCARSINGGQNYKGESWWTDAKGYVSGRVWVDGHPKAVKRHRWLMEQHLGRALLADEDVHHIDGDKQNNDLSNLQVICHADHSRITNADRWARVHARAAIAKTEGQS